MVTDKGLNEKCQCQNQIIVSKAIFILSMNRVFPILFIEFYLSIKSKDSNIIPLDYSSDECN